MLTVPFSSEPAQSFDVQLGDDKFTIDAFFNERPNYDTGVWTFTLTRKSDGVVLLSNVPILIGQDMLEPYALGIGALIAVDTSSAFVDAGVDDLGDRVVVYWYSEDDKASLAAFFASKGVPL